MPIPIHVPSGFVHTPYHRDPCYLPRDIRPATFSLPDTDFGAHALIGEAVLAGISRTAPGFGDPTSPAWENAVKTYESKG